MIRVMGSAVRIVRCASSPHLVGLEGTVALESMKMLTIVSSNSRKLLVPKDGTVLLLKRTNQVVIADDMKGRLEERLAKGTEI